MRIPAILPGGKLEWSWGPQGASNIVQVQISIMGLSLQNNNKKTLLIP